MVLLFLIACGNELVWYLRMNAGIFEIKPNAVTSID